MRRFPPLEWLRAFEAAARHMSFTAAAREMALTQSAISQRIRLLEHELGQPLFVRLPHALQLTETGQAYLPTVRKAFELITVGTEEVFGPRGEERVVLRTTPSFFALWLAPRLHRFQAHYPDVTLHLVSAVWPGDFGSGRTDLEIRYGHGSSLEARGERLTRGHLFPVCTIDIAQRLESPAALSGETLIHTIGFETGWSQWLMSVGAPDISDHSHPMLCDSAMVALELAARGEGVALARSVFVDHMLASGRLIRPFQHSVDAGDSFYLFNTANNPLSAAASALRQWLCDEALSDADS